MGEGEGLWDGGFEFEDALTYATDGRPRVEFRQLTWDKDGSMSHSEAGYLLLEDGGVVHMTVAEPSGVTETLSGTVAGESVTLRSVEIGHTPGAKPVTATARRISLHEDDLVVEVDIGMNDEPPVPHTRSLLRRTVSPAT